MNHYHDNHLFEYMSKRCKTYDQKTRSIHTSELSHLCKHFRLDFHSLADSVKSNSQGYVTYTELSHYFPYHDSRIERVQSPGPPPPPTSSTIPTTNTPYSISRAFQGLPSHQYHYTPIPYTDESFTPDCTPEDNLFHHQEIGGCVSPTDGDIRNNQKPADYDPLHWTNPNSPPEQWVGDNFVNSNSRGRGGHHCTNCLRWQKIAQERETDLYATIREKERLQSLVDRLQKELQQSADYFSAYQMALKDKDRYKQEVKRLKEGSISDGGSTGYLERQNEELKRSKEEIESSLKQYKRYCSTIKHENDRFKHQFQQLQCEIWTMKDEKQSLETSLLQRDSKLDGRMPGYPQSMQQAPTLDSENEPVKDLFKSRTKPLPPDNSENPSALPREQGQVFVVLREDVSSNVLPETLNHDKRDQMICGLQNCHSIEELIRCLVSYGFGSSMDEKSQGYKVDNDLLRCQVKSLESKNNTLASSFETAKQETEEMFCKLSKVEANNCRLRLVVQLCQQACEVHEMLYEMKEAEARPASTSSTFSPIEFDSPTRTSSHDPNAGKNVLSRVRSLLRIMESNQELQTFLPTVHGKMSTADWNLSMSQYTGTTSGLSCASSLGPEAELNSTEVEQLKVYYQALVRYSKHLLDTQSVVDGLQGVETLKSPNITQDSVIGDPHLNGGRILDMEDSADTEELCKIREEKAELRSQIYMMEQSKRSMELQLSKVTIQHSMLERHYADQRALYEKEKKKKQRLKDRIKQMKADNPHVTDWSEQNEQIKIAWDEERDSTMRYEELFNYMQSHVHKSQNTTEKLVEFVKELLRANRALVEAFERAKKRQQVEKRQLKSEMKSLMSKTLSLGHTVP